MTKLTKGGLRKILTTQTTTALQGLISCVYPTKDELIAIILAVPSAKLTKGVRGYGWDFKVE